MAIIVSYVQKNGKPGKATFPDCNREQAEKYAKSVRGTLSESNLQVAPARFLACPLATDGLQRQATSAYYRAHGRDRPMSARPLSAEQRAERMAEHFAEARVSGQAMEDAWSDWDATVG